YIWLVIFGVPYPVLLSLLVAFLDLIPVIGSTIGGAIVTPVALTVSLPVAIAPPGFYISYPLARGLLFFSPGGGPDRAGPRGGVSGRGACRRRADGHHRRTGGHPGGRGPAALPAGGSVPPPGRELGITVGRAAGRPGNIGPGRGGCTVSLTCAAM